MSSHQNILIFYLFDCFVSCIGSCHPKQYCKGCQIKLSKSLLHFSTHGIRMGGTFILEQLWKLFLHTPLLDGINQDIFSIKFSVKYILKTVNHQKTILLISASYPRSHETTSKPGLYKCIPWVSETKSFTFWRKIRSNAIFTSNGFFF